MAASGRIGIVIGLAAAAALLGGEADARASDIERIAGLVRQAEPGKRDSGRWAKAILVALDRNGLERSPENVCAVIAVIDQESNFEANPRVPNLGPMALKAFRKKVNGSASLKTVFAAFPAMRRQIETDIGKAKTERDLDLAARRAFDTIRAHWALGTLISMLDIYESESAIFESINEVKTVGSMQVSVAFARQQTLAPEREEVEETYRLRDSLYTLEGGIEYGVQQLLGYSTPYSQKIHRFADYNAGRYASRNAAFQSVISKLGGETLALDGDLLRYGEGGRVAVAASNTETLLRRVARDNGLGLGYLAIRSDLAKEKDRAFEQTRTYRLVRRLYRERTGREPPVAIVPDIALDSIKLSSDWTTRRFAEKVDGRYRTCLKRWNRAK